MRVNRFRIIVFLFVNLILLSNSTNGQNSTDQKQIEVILRMVGHQVLLSVNDSTSRILPIQKNGERYKIQFESEFEINPDTLVKTIDDVVKETKLSSKYLVEVDDCKTNALVYSFKVDIASKSDVIPCRYRNLPKSCYSLLFTLYNTHEIESKSNIQLGVSRNDFWHTNKKIIILGITLLILLTYFFLTKRRKKIKNDPNVIALGAYHFDKRNTELLIEHQKIDLTNKEADLLMLLYNSANTTVERDVILNLVWGDEGDYVGRTLDVFISKLRKKLEFDTQVKIVNVRGVGYKLVVNE